MQARSSERPTPEMYKECQELLQMFGIPYLIAPQEAEAQCAWLNEAGLVDGVVTDDSDVFLFGGQRVYRHIFENQKYAESYYLEDVQRELGLTREKLVSLVRPSVLFPFSCPCPTQHNYVTCYVAVHRPFVNPKV